MISIIAHVNSRPEDDGNPKHANMKPKAPGDPGVWIPITIDAITFLCFFTFFTMARINDPVLFEQSRQHLNVTLGFVNTLILLTSSWFVVKAVEAAKERIPAKIQSNLLTAILFGLMFVVLKVFGYTEDIMAGHTITTNQFFGYYFALTGLHFMHVIIGLIILTVFFFKARSGSVNGKYLVWLESAGIFWHMVDMLWVFLFPMFYLSRAI